MKFHSVLNANCSKIPYKETIERTTSLAPKWFP